mmetsp:Transcript_99553/g.277113  ORF Transcript_99553/g.277113 Transcript_99553/m.277113 type:complete len:203 (-) Transcript_99553:2305-2913(-)
MRALSLELRLRPPNKGCLAHPEGTAHQQLTCRCPNQDSDIGRRACSTCRVHMWDPGKNCTWRNTGPRRTACESRTQEAHADTRRRWSRDSSSNSRAGSRCLHPEWGTASKRQDLRRCCSRTACRSRNTRAAQNNRSAWRTRPAMTGACRPLRSGCERGTGSSRRSRSRTPPRRCCETVQGPTPCTSLRACPPSSRPPTCPAR